MKTMEQLKAKHAEEIRDLEFQHAIAAASPVQPKFVVKSGELPPCACYTVKTLAEALILFKMFTVVPFHKTKNSWTRLIPWSHADQDNYTLERGPFAAHIDVNQGEGFGPSAKLTFFAETKAGLISVNVDFGVGYIGASHSLGARLIRNGERGNVIDKRPNEIIRQFCDDVIGWGTGEMSNAHYSYLFKAEVEEARPGGDFQYTIDQLMALAEKAGT